MKIIGAVNLGWHMLCTCYAHAMQCICYMSASDRSASLFEAWALHLLEEMEVRPAKPEIIRGSDGGAIDVDLTKLIYGYGSIPINTIFSGMNIHLPAILMFTRVTRF